MRVGVHLGPFYASTRGGSGRSGNLLGAYAIIVFGPGALIAFILANLTEWHGWYDLINDHSLDWALKGGLLTPVVYVAALLFACAYAVGDPYDLDISDSTIVGRVVVSLIVGVYTIVIALLGLLTALIVGDLDHRTLYVSVATALAILPIVVNTVFASSAR
jgi:hypothetical protein